MNKQQAINIVRETFESPFDKGRFTAFIKNLLNEPDLTDGFGPRSGNYIPDSFKGFIEKYERLGKYKDSEEKRVDLLIVYLKKETSIERARSMQRNFIAGYLQGNYGSNNEKDAALVAFVSPNGEDWRFSLVKLDVRLEAGDEGKLKVKDEFTPAKRWSFLVGSHEKSHTAQTQFVPIMQDTDNNPTLAKLEEAFNIEKVTKEFFEKYRELFIRTKEALDKAVKANPATKSDFERKGINTVDLAKKLLGQIIFLYYLQKKGWFGVPKDKKWGDGSKNFLRELFTKSQNEKKNFFNDILEPLFYEALRIDRSHDDHYYKLFDCKIPFLNGGLFDPMNNYDWVKTEILLSNTLFSHKTKDDPEGDGILDVFDLYNFTVKEDEPFEKEVAIDPELLGKAYEKFNAIRPDNYEEFTKALKSGKKGEESKFNKQYGVYYTPREIVHYMCQQSLINYLYSELNPNVVYQGLGSDQFDMFGNAAKGGQMDMSVEHRPMAEIAKEDIALLIQHGENWRENEERVETTGKETVAYSYKTPESIRENAALIDQKLAAIKVCDPAVGSGAFPVGMMSEIVRARDVLKTWTKTKKTVYDFKRECIENSLYGVDIDAGAVEIAKLRLWLSLIVDEDDIQNIKPLPNLDYKVVQGNSLVGVQKNLFNLNLFAELEKLKPSYFNATSPNKKQEFKKKIDNLIDQITEGRAQFDFDIYFSEIFHEKNGFDVLIANPPYVEFKNLAKAIKSTLASYESVSGKYDLYIPFIERGYSLLRNNGLAIYICPTRFMQRDYGEGIRKFIKNKFSIQEIIDFGGLQVFEGAMNYTGIVSMEKKTLSQYAFSYIKFGEIQAEQISTLDFTNSLWQKKSNSYLAAFKVDSEELVQGAWYFAETTSKAVLDKIRLKGLPLRNICKGIYQGVSTGKDDVFVVDEKTVKERKFEKKLLQPFLKGKDIGRFLIKWAGNYLIYPYDLDGNVIAESELKRNYPNIYIYLSERKKDLAGRDYFERSSKKWYELWNQRTASRFKTHKIVTLDNANKNSFAFDADGFLGTTTVYSIVLNMDALDKKYVLGVLNSSILEYFHKRNTIPQAGGFYRYQASFIEKLPICEATNEQQKPIILLVDRILAVKRANPQADTSKWEAEIDQLVYQLYGLTQEEIDIVEGK